MQDNTKSFYIKNAKRKETELSVLQIFVHLWMTVQLFAYSYIKKGCLTLRLVIIRN